jgi:hypothetical protein
MLFETNHRWTICLVATIAMCIGGCAASVPRASVTRLGATGIRPNVTVATLVTQWENCPASRDDLDPRCLPVEITSEMQRGFAVCLEVALGKTEKKGIRVLPGDVFQQRFMPLGKLMTELLDDKEMLRFLGEPSVHEALEADRVGFLVTMDRYTLERPWKTGGYFSGGPWGIVRESYQETVDTIGVWSVSKKGKVGVLKQRCPGGTAWGVAWFLWVPIFPLYANDDSQSKACQTIGQELVEFLFSDAQPEF